MLAPCLREGRLRDHDEVSVDALISGRTLSVICASAVNFQLHKTSAQAPTPRALWRRLAPDGSTAIVVGQVTCRRLAHSGHLAVGIEVGVDDAGNWPHYQCDLSDLDR